MTWQPKYTITKEILFNLTRIEQVRETFENKPPCSIELFT